MAQCRHAHHNSGSSTADIWTKLAAVGEGTTSYISDSFWLGSWVDLLIGADDAGFGLSWYGLSAGMILAAITAAGSVYSHTALNMAHQNNGAEEEHDEHCEHDHKHLHEKSVLINGDEDEHKHYSATDTEIEIDQEPIELEHEHTHDNTVKPNTGLTALQKAALLGDYISHTGDIAGPIVFVSDIVGGKKMPVWGGILVQCSATLFGGITSIANVRTCRNSMLELNRRQAPSLT